jgi:ribose transport system substrate-binding protein
MPVIVMGNREDELTWWKQQKDASGYTTMSTSIAPGSATLAFWVTQLILDGVEVPKDLTMPLVVVQQDNLEAMLESTPKGGVTNVEYTRDEALAFVEAAK